MTGDLRLAPRGRILVNHILAGHFVYRAHGICVQFFGCCSIGGFQHIFDGSLERRHAGYIPLMTYFVLAGALNLLWMSVH